MAMTLTLNQSASPNTNKYLYSLLANNTNKKRHNNVEGEVVHRPRLQRFDANHVKSNIKIRNKLTAENYVPHPLVIRQYASYPYITYSNILVHGYIGKIREQSRSQTKVITMLHSAVPPLITKLCQKYYFIKEDGLFQLIYKISRILKKLKRRCITMQLLNVIIMKCLHLNNHQATSYCNDLIRFEYIVPVKPINSSLNTAKYIQLNPSNQLNQKKLYQISVATSVLFNRK